METNAPDSEGFRQMMEGVAETALSEFANLELDDDPNECIEAFRRLGQLQVD